MAHRISSPSPTPWRIVTTLPTSIALTMGHDAKSSLAISVSSSPSLGDPGMPSSLDKSDAIVLRSPDPISAIDCQRDDSHTHPNLADVEFFTGRPPTPTLAPTPRPTTPGVTSPAATEFAKKHKLSNSLSLNVPQEDWTQSQPSRAPYSNVHYFELTVLADTSANDRVCSIGVCANVQGNGEISSNSVSDDDTNSFSSIKYDSMGLITYNNSGDDIVVVGSAPSFSRGDTVGIGLELSAPHRVLFSKNGLIGISNGFEHVGWSKG